MFRRAAICCLVPSPIPSRCLKAGATPIGYKTYFTTYAASDAVNVSSLTGTVTIRDSSNGDSSSSGDLAAWINKFLVTAGPPGQTGPNTSFVAHPWLATVETFDPPFQIVTSLMPGTLRVTA